MTMEQLMVASFALLRHRIQCDQIGLFMKVLGDKFSYKSSRKIWWLLASCEKIKTSGKKYFWSTFEKIGLLWIPSSGHTASQTSSTFISEKQQSKSKQLTLLCLNDELIDLRHCIKDPPWATFIRVSRVRIPLAKKIFPSKRGIKESKRWWLIKRWTLTERSLPTQEDPGSNPFLFLPFEHFLAVKCT